MSPWGGEELDSSLLRSRLSFNQGPKPMIPSSPIPVPHPPRGSMRIYLLVVPCSQTGLRNLPSLSGSHICLVSLSPEKTSSSEPGIVADQRGQSHPAVKLGGSPTSGCIRIN